MNSFHGIYSLHMFVWCLNQVSVGIDGAVPKNRVLCSPRTAASSIAGTLGCFCSDQCGKSTHVFTLQTEL